MGPQRRGLTIQQKLQVIQYSKTHKCGIRTLGQMFGISKSSASDILRQEARLLTRAAQGGGHSSRMKLLSTQGEEMDSQVYAWYKQKSDNNEMPSRSDIQEKALQIAEELKIPNFQASNGWLTKFRQRHGIKTQRNKSTTQSFDDETARINELFSTISTTSTSQDPLDTNNWPNLDTLREQSDIKSEQELNETMDPEEVDDYDVYEAIHNGDREINNYGEALKCVQALKEFLAKIGHNKALNITLELESHFKDITSDSA